MGAYPNRRGLVRVGLRTKRGLKGAVVRNRLKRQLRDICRAQRGRFAHGQDIVVVLHPRVVPTLTSTLEQDFLKACRKLALLS